MRIIKFRAKARLSKNWVYGYYVEREGISYGMIYDSSGLGTKVDKKTVGQYTGMKDYSAKYKKFIYEGDIIEYIFRGEKLRTVIKWLSKNGGVWACFPFGNRSYKVIGNIHDNPKLL